MVEGRPFLESREGSEVDVVRESLRNEFVSEDGTRDGEMRAGDPDEEHRTA